MSPESVSWEARGSESLVSVDLELPNLNERLRERLDAGESGPVTVFSDSREDESLVMDGE